MKKFLVPLFISILVFLVACSIEETQPAYDEIAPVANQSNNDSGHQDVPRTIVISGSEELVDMREIVKADEQAVLDYLQRTQYRANGFKNRTDVVDFLNLLDSLPIPGFPQATLLIIIYYPDNQEALISYKIETGETYMFAYDLKGRNVEELLRQETGVTHSPIYQIEDGKDGQIKVYSFPIDIDTNSRSVRYYMDVNGYCIHAVYQNENNRNESPITPEQIFGDMRLFTITDITENAH